MFQSILIGILPCRKEFWPIIKEKVSEEEDVSIRWRSFAEIEDEGTVTLVVSAVSDADPNSMMQFLHRELASAFPEENIETEMWATAPSPIDLKPKDGYQLCKDKDEKEWQDWTSHTLKEFGIFVQEGILSQEQVHEIRSIVDQAINEVENLLRTHRPEIEIGKDSFLFKEIASRNLQRFDLRLDSIASDFVTKCVMENPTVKSILTRSLGNYDDIDYDVSAVYSKPGACVQGWHADGDHQKGGKFAGWSNDGWKNELSDPFAICVFIPLIDLNESVGFTQFWPKSHWTKDLAGFGPIAMLTNTTFDAMGAAGDAIFYDYRLMHRGMPNNSKLMRPVLQVVVKKKWYVEKANYGEESIVTNKE